MSNLIVHYERPTSPDLAAMHDARIAFNFEGYDPADCFTPPIADLEKPDMRFRVARMEGVLLGMGALKLHGDWAEVKAVFVSPEARGKGAARAIMDALEDVAREEGILNLRLETGNLHKDALQFYPRLGWVEIPRFDPYPVNETSLFFEKVLT